MDWIDIAPFWAATNSVLIVAACAVGAVLAIYWVQSILARLQYAEKLIAYLHAKLEKIEKDSNKELLYAQDPDAASEKILPRESAPTAPTPEPTPIQPHLAEFLRQQTSGGRK
ncbi:MAG: hypothetical protein EYC62_06425 [Alphaproteobacteria bacterium]|nr:MAG: hypothetical protein EYC62_06425 [Alphaproteobacteria bacterium]